MAQFDIAALRQTAIRTDPFNSDRSVADTVAQMAHVVRISIGHSIIRDAVERATRDLDPWASDRDIASSIFYWIKTNIKFSLDETIAARYLGMSDFDAMDTELLIVPTALLSLPVPMGDCDDFSTLTATMLMALGFPCAFVTIAADSSMPDTFSHVYVKAWLPDSNSGLYMDTSHGTYPGWEHDKYTRKKEWPI